MEPEQSQTQEQKEEFRMTNAKFAVKNEEFIQACKVADIKNTTRQASKWRMKKGKAWQTSHPSYYRSIRITH